MLASAPTTTLTEVLRFGDFELHLSTGELTRLNRRIRLQPQPFQLLTLLVRCAGQLLTREEVQRRIWDYDVSVDFEHCLNFCIQQIRAALRDNARNPRYIETLPRRGYRFIAEVIPQPSSHNDQDEFQNHSVRLNRALLSRRHQASGDIGVLPLKALSPGLQSWELADAVTDLLIGAFARQNAFGVISRTSLLRYKDSSKLLPDIAQELGVDLIVEGTAIRLQDTARIQVSLIDAYRDRHVWSKQYDCPAESKFGVLENIVDDIVSEVTTKAAPRQRRRTASFRGPVSYRPARHTVAEKGFLESTWDEQGLNREIQKLKEIVRDSRDAFSFAEMAGAYSILGSYVAKPQKRLAPMARAAAASAVSISPDLPEAHVGKGLVSFFLDHDLPTADREFKRALSLKPDCTAAHQWYGALRASVDDWGTAFSEISLAHELSPRSPFIIYQLGWCHLCAGANDLAIRYFRDALAMRPDFSNAYIGLGMAFLRQSRFDLAIEACQNAVVQSVREPYKLSILGYALGVAKEGREATRVIQEFEGLGKEQDISPLHIAGVYSGLGESDAAIHWLDEALKERGSGIALLRTWPFFRTLSANPAYSDFLRRACLRAPER
jgi:DNA-binding winged helix-turn-helix (wHTH) protein